MWSAFSIIARLHCTDFLTLPLAFQAFFCKKVEADLRSVLAVLDACRLKAEYWLICMLTAWQVRGFCHTYVCMCKYVYIVHAYVCS